MKSFFTIIDKLDLTVVDASDEDPFNNTSQGEERMEVDGDVNISLTQSDQDDDAMNVSLKLERFDPHQISGKVLFWWSIDDFERKCIKSKDSLFLYIS